MIMFRMRIARIEVWSHDIINPTKSINVYKSTYSHTVAVGQFHRVIQIKIINRKMASIDIKFK